LYIVWNFQSNKIKRSQIGSSCVVKSYQKPIRAIPLSIKHEVNKKLTIMVVKDGHMRMSSLNLSGVTKMLKLGNDFGGSYKIIQCTTWITMTYPRMMFILVWSGVIPIVTTNILVTNTNVMGFIHLNVHP
jgi:hypothetical protein